MSRCDDLVLIPTAAERELCKGITASLDSSKGISVQLCGWGLVQSAVLTTKAILEYRPSRVWLVGIAGALMRFPMVSDTKHEAQALTHELDLQIGKAFEFSRVAIDGIGVGQGADHVSFEELGWGKLFGGPVCPGGRIELSQEKQGGLGLLSVCSASANFKEACLRNQHFPDALAEDMESYSVAFACQQLQVPLRVFRGISNRAGDRQHSGWQATAAMRSAIQLATLAIDGKTL